MTFYLIVVLLLVIAIHIGILYFLKRKPSKLKKKPFLFHFLTPKSQAGVVYRINILLLIIIGLLALLSGYSYYLWDRPYLYSLAPVFCCHHFSFVPAGFPLLLSTSG